MPRDFRCSANKDVFLNPGAIIMDKTHDRRFFAFLGFLFFLFFLGFLGSNTHGHFAFLAAPAALASLAALVFIPRNADQVPAQHRLDTVADIFRALIGKI
ncbi:MAG: hypothetical protein Rhob2KO_44750 [Rhodopirellula baltica]